MPFASRSDGSRIYYEVHGDGPALVRAHGAGGNRLSWWQQVPHFARGHRVIVFDHRGFGRSGGEAFATPHFGADLEAVLDAAQAGPRLAIVAQSMGGWTGLSFALRHPERVRALVLACTTGGVMDDTVMALVRETPKRVAEAGIRHTPAIGASFARRRPDLLFLYDQIGALNTNVRLDAVTRLFDPEARIAPEVASGLAVPTLMITGSEDLLFPPEAIRSAARALPGVRVEEFERTGHSSYFEQPERFNALVEEFLAAHP